MHILVASDIHGSQAAVKRLRAVAERRNPDLIVLLGDILYHGPRNPLPEEYNPAEVARLFREWLAETSLPFMCVRGNCDAEVDAMLLPFPLAESAWIFPDGAHVLALHGHTLPSDCLPLLSSFPDIRIFPWRKKEPAGMYGIPAASVFPREAFRRVMELSRRLRSRSFRLREKLRCFAMFCPEDRMGIRPFSQKGMPPGLDMIP